MDKRNTILLTVIAVATLLVAVVGATFAYFTAQMGPGTNTNITVTTSTQDTLSYGAFKALYIVANETNFAQDKGTQMATASGTISLQANSNNQDGQEFQKADYCYTATINVALNQFVYAPEDTDGADGTNNPELVLALSKDEHNFTNGELEGLTYKNVGSKLVCDQSSGKTTFTEEECQSKEINGFDITTYGATDPKAIKIKNWSPDEGASSNEKLNYVFHITADEAGKITEHNWKAELYFVNYDWDQQYNTHKMFTATWDFQTVDCTTGEVKAN